MSQLHKVVRCHFFLYFMDHHFKREIADRYHAQLELHMELIEFDHELNYINQMNFWK